MQKFHEGDHVMIAEDLGPYMKHFTSGCEAIVLGSYDDQFGGGETDSYSLYIRGHGSTSWYEEHQLTMIENNRPDLIDVWKQEMADEVKKKSDLDWIFRNGKRVAKEYKNKVGGPVTLGLCRSLGIPDTPDTDEGLATFIRNSLEVFTLAEPFLKKKDKAGWLKFCSEQGGKYANQII